MKSLLVVLISGVALSSTAFAAQSRGPHPDVSHHRSYDLRDVQPYPGETLPGCPYGAGYANTQCNAGMGTSADADVDGGTYHHWVHAKRYAPHVMSSYDRTTAIQESHGTL